MSLVETMTCGCGHLKEQHAVVNATLPRQECNECACPFYHEWRENVPARISERWTVRLPEHRAYRTDWDVWEKERLASMKEHLECGDLLFDIGAEEGDFPALFSMWGCDLVLVEPNPKVWPCIKECWDANALHPPIGWWVGFASDTIDEYPPNKDFDSRDVQGWPACAYGEVIPWHGFRHLAQQADATPQTTIDELAIKFGLPAAITMDIEGSELRALRGAQRVLRDVRPKVWVSVHPEFMQDLYGHTKDQLMDYMDSFGYMAELLAIDHEEHWLFLP